MFGMSSVRLVLGPGAFRWTLRFCFCFHFPRLCSLASSFSMCRNVGNGWSQTYSCRPPFVLGPCLVAGFAPIRVSFVLHSTPFSLPFTSAFSYLAVLGENCCVNDCFRSGSSSVHLASTPCRPCRFAAVLALLAFGFLRSSILRLSRRWFPTCRLVVKIIFILTASISHRLHVDLAPLGARRLGAVALPFCCRSGAFRWWPAVLLGFPHPLPVFSYLAAFGENYLGTYGVRFESTPCRP